MDSITILVLYQPEGSSYFERIQQIILPKIDQSSSIVFKGWEEREVRIG
jgi:hypothetical protein